MEKTFNIGEVIPNEDAILMLMVKGMTVSNTDAQVFINNKNVGVIERSEGANRDHWFTQIINIGKRKLIRGNNRLRISAVNNPTEGSDRFDDFFIKDVICYFKQNS